MNQQERELIDRAQAILCDIPACSKEVDDAITLIERALSVQVEPCENAKELVWRIDYICNSKSYKSNTDSRVSDAAALIEQRDARIRAESAQEIAALKGALLVAGTVLYDVVDDRIYAVDSVMFLRIENALRLANEALLARKSEEPCCETCEYIGEHECKNPDKTCADDAMDFPGYKRRIAQGGEG